MSMQKSKSIQLGGVIATAASIGVLIGISLGVLILLM
jgi:hypothetical protein